MSKKVDNHQIEGQLQAFNISPKGTYEGLIVLTKAGIVQVNFPPEFAESIGAAVKKGDRLTLKVSPFEDDRPAEHTVYHLHEISSKKGGPISLQGSTFNGKVARLNYAKHGEANGAVLDSGDFIHTKPHGAKLLGLKVGQTIQGEGDRKPMVSGTGVVIEATIVNGISLDKKHAAKKVPAKKKSAATKKSV